MSTTSNATDVTVRYGDRAILDSATLAIDEGQRIGLVGRNGCGKHCSRTGCSGTQNAALSGKQR